MNYPDRYKGDRPQALALNILNALASLPPETRIEIARDLGPPPLGPDGDKIDVMLEAFDDVAIASALEHLAERVFKECDRIGHRIEAVDRLQTTFICTACWHPSTKSVI